MSGGPLKPKFLFCVSLSLCCLLVGPAFGKQRRSAKHPEKQEVTVQPVSTAPPPTLAEMPASPPQVSFQGGQLTILAQNSTLGDILKAVRAQTSATVDLPGNAPERVVGQFGPGPARDVLTSLLNGSHFNYMLLGSPTDPNALDRVILMAKSSSGSESAPQQPTQEENAYNQAMYNRPPIAPMAAPAGNTTVVEGQDAADDDTADDSTDSTDDATTDDATDDADQADDQQATDGQQTQVQPDGQQVKTPEQLLQQLQQRQQQLQQQIQQGGQPGAPPAFPTPGPPGIPTPPH